MPCPTSALHPAWIFPSFSSARLLQDDEVPIKGKIEELLDGHGKQLLQALLTAPQAPAALRANEG